MLKRCQKSYMLIIPWLSGQFKVKKLLEHPDVQLLFFFTGYYIIYYPR